MGKKKKKLNLRNEQCVVEKGTLIWINPTLKEFVVPSGVEEINIGSYLLKNEKDIEWVKRFDADFFDEDYENKMLLEKIVFSDTLEIIREYGLYGCKYLKEVVFPSNLLWVENNAFENCESVEKIVINSAKTALYENVFSNCNKVKEVTMPSGWRYCDEYWFLGDSSSIEKINLIGELNPYGEKEFKKYMNDHAYDTGYYSLYAPNVKEINIIKKDDNMLLNETTTDKFYTDLWELIFETFGVSASSRKLHDFSKIKVTFLTEDNYSDTAKILNSILNIIGSIDVFIQLMRCVCEKVEGLPLEDRKQMLYEVYDNLKEKQDVNKMLFTLLNGDVIVNHNSRKGELLLFEVNGFYDERNAAVYDMAFTKKSTSEILTEFNGKIRLKNKIISDAKTKGLRKVGGK